MPRRYLVLSAAALATVALLTVGLVYFMGWWPRTAEQPPGPAPVPAAPHSDSFSARNWSYYLRPVSTEKPGPKPTAQEAWDNLFPGMAADPATRELLQRLYGGLHVGRSCSFRPP